MLPWGRGSSGGCATPCCWGSVREAGGGRSGGSARECPVSGRQRFDEVVEEGIVGSESEDEAAAGAPDGGSDGDEAEAEPLGVARAFALG